MIVGNYATGKSHLMSVLSAIAEYDSLSNYLQNPQVVESARSVVGKFKVIRTELGSTTMDLREFVTSQLEATLSDWGIEYQFPPRDKIPKNISKIKIQVAPVVIKGLNMKISLLFIN